MTYPRTFGRPEGRKPIVRVLMRALTARGYEVLHFRRPLSGDWIEFYKPSNLNQKNTRGILSIHGDYVTYYKKTRDRDLELEDLLWTLVTENGFRFLMEWL